MYSQNYKIIFYIQQANILEQLSFDAWEGGALRKYPVGIFSERASLPLWRTKLEDPSAVVYEYKYDNLGRMLWEKTPKGITKHGYDQFGKPTKEETIGDETYLKQEFTYHPLPTVPKS